MEIKINKKAIPNLLNLLGKALLENQDIKLIKTTNPDNKIIEFVELCIGDEKFLIDSYSNPIERESLQDISADIKPFTEEELEDFENIFNCPEFGFTDRYSCKNLCSFRKECKINLP